MDPRRLSDRAMRAVDGNDAFRRRLIHVSVVRRLSDRAMRAVDGNDAFRRRLIHVSVVEGVDDLRFDRGGVRAVIAYGAEDEARKDNISLRDWSIVPSIMASTPAS